MNQETNDQIQKRLGIAPTFNPQDFIKVAQQLVDADEVERALWLLDNVPAYYRSNQVKEIIDFKSSILSRMVTPAGYADDQHDCGVMPFEEAQAVVKLTLRGVLLEYELNGPEEYHVVDVGPGEYWIPKALSGNYSYKPVGLDIKTREEAFKDKDIIARMGRQTGQTGVFVALEVIEHLPDPGDLAVECAKHFTKEPHYIHLSTPLYTFDASPKKDAKLLPHLRAYTPNEFQIEAFKLWPHYNWQLYVGGPIMSLRGVHPDAKRKDRLL